MTRVMPGPADKPFEQRKLSTLFLRVPYVDWAKVRGGHKREFRSAVEGVTQVWSVATPTPIVAYSVSGPPNARRHHGPQLMVLEGTWREMLGAISGDSLEREGFTEMAQFRRYYMQRTRQRFKPLTEVQVYRVRPWYRSDADMMGMLLLDRLYGAYMEEHAAK